MNTPARTPVQATPAWLRVGALLVAAACASEGSNDSTPGGGGGGGIAAGAGGGGGGSSGKSGKDAASDPMRESEDAAAGGGNGAADAALDPAIDAATDATAVDGPGLADAGPVVGGPFALTSSVFKEGELIIPMYRCRTQNLSPPLSWTPGPAGTKSYAVTMAHNTSLHWVLWDIPASVTSLPLDVAKVAEPPIPAGSKQAKPNIDGATWYGYTGPCPGGAGLQKYLYVVYALKVDTLPGVTTASTTKQVDAVIQQQKLARATLEGTAAAGK